MEEIDTEKNQLGQQLVRASRLAELGKWLRDLPMKSTTLCRS